MFQIYLNAQMHQNCENKSDQNWFETKMRLVPSVSLPKLVGCWWQGRKCQFLDEIGNHPPRLLLLLYFWQYPGISVIYKALQIYHPPIE